MTELYRKNPNDFKQFLPDVYNFWKDFDFDYEMLEEIFLNFSADTEIHNVVKGYLLQQSSVSSGWDYNRAETAITRMDQTGPLKRGARIEVAPLAWEIASNIYKNGTDFIRVYKDKIVSIDKNPSKAEFYAKHAARASEVERLNS